MSLSQVDNFLCFAWRILSLTQHTRGRWLESLLHVSQLKLNTFCWRETSKLCVCCCLTIIQRFCCDLHLKCIFRFWWAVLSSCFDGNRRSFWELPSILVKIIGKRAKGFHERRISWEMLKWDEKEERQRLREDHRMKSESSSNRETASETKSSFFELGWSWYKK
jgi:hypothetical protein